MTIKFMVAGLIWFSEHQHPAVRSAQASSPHLSLFSCRIWNNGNRHISRIRTFCVLVSRRLEQRKQGHFFRISRSFFTLLEICPCLFISDGRLSPRSQQIPSGRKRERASRVQLSNTHSQHQLIQIESNRCVIWAVLSRPVSSRLLLGSIKAGRQRVWFYLQALSLEKSANVETASLLVDLLEPRVAVYYYLKSQERLVVAQKYGFLWKLLAMKADLLFINKL